MIKLLQSLNETVSKHILFERSELMCLGLSLATVFDCVFFFLCPSFFLFASQQKERNLVRARGCTAPDIRYSEMKVIAEALGMEIIIRDKV